MGSYQAGTPQAGSRPIETSHRSITFIRAFDESFAGVPMDSGC